MSIDQWITLFQSAGPVITAIGFFVWRDWKRESSMTARIRSLEDYQRNQMAGMIKESVTLQTETNALLRDFARTTELCRARANA